MTTFQLRQAPDVTFDAVGVSVDPGGRQAPVVERKVMGRVLAETRRKFAWVKGNVVVELDGPGHVLEVLRPRPDGLFDLGAASWVAGADEVRIRSPKSKPKAKTAASSKAAARG